jgi:hypothetical protein
MLLISLYDVCYFKTGYTLLKQIAMVCFPEKFLLFSGFPSSCKTIVLYRPVAGQRPRNGRVQPLLCNRRISKHPFVNLSVVTCLRCFLARGFIYHEYGGARYIRNVGSHKIYTAPHPKRRHSSYITWLHTVNCRLDILSLRLSLFFRIYSISFPAAGSLSRDWLQLTILIT